MLSFSKREPGSFKAEAGKSKPGCDQCCFTAEHWNSYLPLGTQEGFQGTDHLILEKEKVVDRDLPMQSWHFHSPYRNL
jgi:hypothetical protein